MRRNFYDIFPKNILDEIKSYKTDRIYRTHSDIPKFIFLCGKNLNEDDGGNRAIIKSYFKGLGRKDLFFINSENLFDKEYKTTLDLLTFEEYIAEFSDAIILFIESYGSACELGAFAVNPHLMNKLFVFSDIGYVSSNSFINIGPLRKLQLHTGYVKYINLKAIIKAANEEKAFEDFENFIDKKIYQVNNNKECVHLNAFMLEMLELIDIFGPIIKEDLIEIYKYLNDFQNFDFIDKAGKKINVKYSFLIKILIVSKIITIDENGYLQISQEDFNIHKIKFEMSSNTLNMFKAKLQSKKYQFKEGFSA